MRLILSVALFLCGMTGLMAGPVPADTLVAPSKTILDSIPCSDPSRMLIIYSDNTWACEKHAYDATNSEEYRVALIIPDVFHIPVQGRVFTPFGLVAGMMHTGVDVSAKPGEKVYCPFDGVVTASADSTSAYGNMIRISHQNGLESIFSNLADRRAEVGQSIACATVIGTADSLAGAGPHLHYELRYSGKALDPAKVMDFAAGVLRAPIYIVNMDALPAEADFYSASTGEQREIYLAQIQINIERERLEKERAERLAKEEAERKAREAAALEAAKRYYTIRNGDTLSRIAVKNHTTVKAICRLNGIKETTILRVGKTIRVR
ncbi:MAG: peptidoglycan DD-metalloendopeptidase family protein [Bacteroidales bacterium]|nr:peptidoglycan DD-metalloendopeptidase family protein [Bacteroidales bacterium]